MKSKINSILLSLTLLGVTGGMLHSAVTSEEAEKLGNELTPMGGEMAGSEDGVIPAWEGGITSPPAGYTVGMHHPDPYAGDEVVAVITAQNMGQYAEYLTDGHKAMLSAYDSYKMKVYPTRRSVSYPEGVYEATKRNAVNAHLVGEGAGVAGARMGAPFPIPQQAEEVMWNHLMRYRGKGASRTITQAAPNRRGKYTLVESRTTSSSTTVTRK